MINTPRTFSDDVLETPAVRPPAAFAYLLVVVWPAAFWSVVVFLLSDTSHAPLITFATVTLFLSMVTGAFRFRI
jgi:hypothetical protein